MARREVVVITGASAGVGRATVREFAKHGAWIGLVARGTDGLEEAKHEVEATGGRAVVLPVDVADPAQVDAAAERVESTLGPIDIWVNNAMASVFSPIKEMTSEEFKRVTEVTYLGYVYGTLAALTQDAKTTNDEFRPALAGFRKAAEALPALPAYGSFVCLVGSAAVRSRWLFVVLYVAGLGLFFLAGFLAWRRARP